ncbi:DUF4013 domain-containing protein [Enorma phocaeensis]|uniref:DUF4013 domain-containing protein n=1 Tax=Enorma phocaeensis TaxID=1871019 RepID=UPI0032079B9C
METKSFGLLASWRTLTSSQGWWKPIALLTLVSWIPIAGQIAVMGCALEWGRFAAWGSNEPPRWESINYSKLLKTGARAFIIQVLMAIVFGSALGWAFDGRGVTFSPSGVWPRGSWLADEPVYRIDVLGAIAWVIGVVLVAVLIAAVLRATLYDAFSAGWRLDRITQMVGRDPGGFARTVLAVAAGSVAMVLVFLVSTAVVGMATRAGFTVFALHHGHGQLLFNGRAFLNGLFSLEPSLMLAVSLGTITLQFVLGALAVCMQLATVHVMATWFRRFEVWRWGNSCDPLPDSVPACKGFRQQEGSAGV